MTIWIVQGTTGEYSDRSEWLVDAHRTEDGAKARVVELERSLQESGIALMERYSGKWERALKKFRKEHDPNFDIDYTGVRWRYAPCDLHE